MGGREKKRYRPKRAIAIDESRFFIYRYKSVVVLLPTFN